MKQTFILVHPTARQRAMLAVNHAPEGYVVEVKQKTRSLAQNARMWAMLEEISRQVVWHGKHLSAEEWKDVFSAALKRQDVVPGLEGGFVVLGQRTSQMTIREMGELMELMEAFGAQRGVRFEVEA